MIMNWIAKQLARPRVVNWLIKRAMKTPYFHIGSADGSEVYMYRYWLFNPYPHSAAAVPGAAKRGRWQFPISIRLHHIMRHDMDRDLHDHPWNARTIILRGGYTEDRIGEREIVRMAGDTAKLAYGEYHRITRVTPDGAWTMFITGKYRGTWGFLVNGVKVHYRKYLGLDPQ